MTSKSLFVKSPFQYILKEIEMPDIADDEVLIEITACGICGYDMEISGYLASNITALGHEYTGIVKAVGKAVDNVSIGDQVSAESSMFCGFCEVCRNGRPDLCQSANKNIWNGYAQGFADYTIAPAKALVVCNNLNPLAAVLSEPAGVSLDLIKTSEINITDDILIIGLGPIGLMALQIARKISCGDITCVDRHINRQNQALKTGANTVYNSMTEIPKEKKFNKILLTAVPQLIPEAMEHAKYGGFITFLGSNFKDGGTVAIDTHALHFNKLQLRSSFASPAMYFPEVHKLMAANIINYKDIITHIYKLDEYETGFNQLRNNKDNAIKVIIINNKSDLTL